MTYKNRDLWKFMNVDKKDRTSGFERFEIWKKKEKLKEHKRCRLAKRKISKQIKISDISANGTTTKKYQFLYWTKTTKNKYKFLNWKLYIATLNINSRKK